MVIYTLILSWSQLTSKNEQSHYNPHGRPKYPGRSMVEIVGLREHLQETSGNHVSFCSRGISKGFPWYSSGTRTGCWSPKHILDALKPMVLNCRSPWTRGKPVGFCRGFVWPVSLHGVSPRVLLSGGSWMVIVIPNTCTASNLMNSWERSWNWVCEKIG